MAKNYCKLNTRVGQNWTAGFFKCLQQLKVSEVGELVSLFRHQTLNFLELTLLHKTLKAARFAIADRVVLNLTNTELLAANIRKK